MGTTGPRFMDPSERVEQNLIELFRHFARTHPSGEIRETRGVSIASCGITFPMFNAAFLSEPVCAARVELERRIVTAATHFGARGLRWAFWVAEDKVSEKLRRRAPEVFQNRGLGNPSRLLGMFAEQVLPASRPQPDLQICEVADERQRLDFCNVLSVTFRLPILWCLELYEPTGLWQCGFTGYVGYVHGEPVTTAATMAAVDALGLYCVATLPSHAGHGYAEAIVRHALERGRRDTGISRSILQSSTAGLPLYQRMGYETVTHIVVFSSV